jgi:hypothetical protein
VKNYSFKKVVLTLGPFRVRGFMAGSSIAVDQDEDKYTKDTGADGEVARVESANEGGSITVTLQQTSPSNDELQAILDGGTVYPLQLKDLNGTTLHSAREAWPTKVAPNDWAKEFNGRVWKLDCAKLKQYVGGGLV